MIGRTNAGGIPILGNATAAEILDGKTALSGGALVTGTMPNRGEVDTDITTKAQVVTIAAGYHNGSGTVQIDATEIAKIASSNIRTGETILGVAGSYDTETISPIAAGWVVASRVGYVNGTKITGTIPSLGATNYTPGTTNQKIAAGKYLQADQTIVGDSDLVAANIKHNVSIFGVGGTYDTETTNPITAALVLANKIGFVNGAKITGTMTDRGAYTPVITTKAQSISIPSGYHNGSGTVTIDSTEQGKIVAGNIKNGTTILGVTGTYVGTVAENALTVTVTNSNYLYSGTGARSDNLMAILINLKVPTQSSASASNRTTSVGTISGTGWVDPTSQVDLAFFTQYTTGSFFGSMMVGVRIIRFFIEANTNVIWCYEEWAQVLDDVGTSYAALTSKKGVGAFRSLDNAYAAFFYSNVQTGN